MPKNVRVPIPTDSVGLHYAAVEHLFVGMTNAAQLKEEGGPLILVDSKGIWVKDIDGREFIDGISGMYFRNAGHGREEIAKAVYDQLTQVSMHVYAGSTPSTVRLAARLADMTPGTLSRTFFTQGGSEANETAMKMAQAYHNRTGGRGRFKVISRRGSYHGGTYGTQWLGEHPGFPRTDFQPVPAHVVHVPQPNPYRCELGGRTPEECAEKCANAIEQSILSQGPDSVSAVLGEPVSQPLGGVVPHPSYWPRVREICDRYGVLLIFDEVITGFGRLGTWFGADFVGVVPDIMTFAKGITSGYFPMGGAIAKKEVADVFNGGPEATFKHMFTYTGHPAGAAAALKNLEITEREKLVDNARARGAQLNERLAEMKEKHPMIGDVRGVGLIQGIEFVKDRKTKEHFDPKIKVNARLTAGLAKRNVWIRVPAYILPIAPPLVISADEMDQLATAIDEAIGEAERELSVA
ncbi:MAG: aspartate aminotransferase family protein [Chloroflexi bacterium]|nr:aspartate aminotransferase family protein [Chloroflexota bacterium]